MTHGDPCICLTVGVAWPRAAVGGERAPNHNFPQRPGWLGWLETSPSRPLPLAEIPAAEGRSKHAGRSF